MKRSGLKDIITDYTFDKFIASEPWQKAIKEAAMEYAENPVGWFALCGQSGAGKTHLCTAICRKFLLSGKRVQYMLWRDEIVKIKEAAKGSEDSDELRKLLDRYKTAEVLYIDDLFKTGRAADNTMPKPTPADINYAFEIINYRYNNPSLLTIISSELTEDELLDIDEAIGGRIYERAKTFTIAKNRDRNYRIKRAVTL
jgi:DNA replication protein DnaC